MARADGICAEGPFPADTIFLRIEKGKYHAVISMYHDQGQIATKLGEFGANILRVDHHRLLLDVPAKGAKLDVTVETRDAAHAEEIFRAFAAAGYQPVHMPSGTALE